MRCLLSTAGCAQLPRHTVTGYAKDTVAEREAASVCMNHAIKSAQVLFSCCFVCNRTGAKANTQLLLAVSGFA
jgi:hypothetical protein